MLYKDNYKNSILRKPSMALSLIVGKEEISIDNAIKAVWGYITENKCLDEQLCRTITPNDRLRPLFMGKQITIFELKEIIVKNLT